MQYPGIKDVEKKITTQAKRYNINTSIVSSGRLNKVFEFKIKLMINGISDNFVNSYLAFFKKGISIPCLRRPRYIP